jgi:hypothetical protein
MRLAIWHELRGRVSRAGYIQCWVLGEKVRGLDVELMDLDRPI